MPRQIKRGRGWFGESNRHSLAAKGITTVERTQETIRDEFRELGSPNPGVIQTMVDQIGKRTLFDVNAREFAYGLTEEGKEFVQFKIHRRGRKIRVIYDRATDTYSLELWYITVGRTVSVKKLREVSDIYNDQLPEVVRDFAS